jgi:DNA-binding MarR family transcriptional regulator
MKEVNTLVELVNLWHEHVKTYPDAAIEDFCKAQLAEPEKDEPVLDTAAEDDNLVGVPILSQVGMTFGRLTRFGLMYSKKALDHLNLSSAIDFNYLRNLDEHESLKKSELIYLSITDFTTGIEVIKRLVKNKYAEVFPDPDDKRSKRIKITTKGKEILEAGYKQMRQMGGVSFGILSESETLTLLSIFKKLNKYHTERFKDVRNMDFDSIVQKTLAEKDKTL